jgi:hypothetical protein
MPFDANRTPSNSALDLTGVHKDRSWRAPLFASRKGAVGMTRNADARLTGPQLNARVVRHTCGVDHDELDELAGLRA